MARKISRREFLRDGTRGVLGACVVLGTLDSAGLGGKMLAMAKSGKKESKKKEPAIEYRTLGRTGLRVTTVGFGAMLTHEPAVIRRGIDLGINYIDTARAYMKGANEEIVGEAIKGRRKKLIIATKMKVGKRNREQLLMQMEKSLKALKTDYVDVIQLHNLKGGDGPKNEIAVEVLTRLKKEGKARFCGVTTHKNQPEVIDAAIQTGFYDVVLVGYNFQSPEEVKQAVKRAGEAGMGVIAMKTQAGGYKAAGMGNLSPHQAALKWVLNDDNVSCAMSGMITIAEVEENVAVMGKKLVWGDRKTLDRYRRSIDSIYCRMCGACNGACPRGVDVQEMNRFLMYAEGYRLPDFARAEYRSFVPGRSARQCAGCRRCKVKCAYGLKVGLQMRRAAAMLG